MIPGVSRHSVLCSSPPVVGGGDDDDVDWVARGLLSSGNVSIVASTLRRSLALLLPLGGDRGGGRLTEFLVGVRRTSIKAGRYNAGWMRLSAGGRKRRAAALAAGPPVLGVGGGSGAVGNSDGRGLDDRAADAYPSRFCF